MRPLFLMVFLWLAGCAVVPDRIAGPVTSSDPVVVPGAAGETVRWGGVLLTVLPMPDQTCFEILSHPLAASGRPRVASEAAHQRFLACQPGFVDPETHNKGADVTVLGRLKGHQMRQIGQRFIRVPLLDISGIQWWRPRPPMSVGNPYGPWFDPFWAPYGPSPYGWSGYGYLRPTIYWYRTSHHPVGARPPAPPH